MRVKQDYSVFLGNVGSCCDRFCRAYGRDFSIAELFERVASIEGIDAVDLVADQSLFEHEDEIVRLIEKTGLFVPAVTVELFADPRWKNGTFSSADPKVRKEAVAWGKRAVDFAVRVKSPIVGIWPGQDGYDYLFSADYLSDRQHFVDGVKEVCRHNSAVTVGLEYKPKEPRTHNYVSNAGISILMAQEVGEANAGVILDYGHALYAGENPAETVALLYNYGNLLCHIHINDNYRYWDDDLIVGTVHTLEYLEFFYWLDRTGYQGYLTIDQFPYREDGRDAVAESARWLDALSGAITRADKDEIGRIIARKDGVAASSLMRKILFGK
jgi:sugar phosphate isomerase/epimerase